MLWGVAVLLELLPMPLPVVAAAAELEVVWRAMVLAEADWV